MPVPELTQYRVYTYDPYFGPQWYFDREAHKRDLAKLARTTQEPEELWEILKEGSDRTSWSTTWPRSGPRR